MKITRLCPVTNQMRTLELPITREQHDAWRSGTLIQDAMPHLTADEREFMISGVTPGMWDKYMKDE